MEEEIWNINATFDLPDLMTVERNPGIMAESEYDFRKNKFYARNSHEEKSEPNLFTGFQ